jgi:hypothetical protein
VNHDDGGQCQLGDQCNGSEYSKIRIKKNTTVMVSDLPSRHKLHGQIGNKRNTRDMKRVRTKSGMSNNRMR